MSEVPPRRRLRLRLRQRCRSRNLPGLRCCPQVPPQWRPWRCWAYCRFRSRFVRPGALGDVLLAATGQNWAEHACVDLGQQLLIAAQGPRKGAFRLPKTSRLQTVESEAGDLVFAEVWQSDNDIIMIQIEAAALCIGAPRWRPRCVRNAYVHGVSRCSLAGIAG